MKKILSNNRAEGHIDTGVKIIIAVVIGALILGGLYLLYTQVINPTVDTKINAMMGTGETFQIRLEGTKLQKSIDGENWTSMTLPYATAETEVTGMQFITKDGETVWVIVSKTSSMYNVAATKDGTTWYPVQSSMQKLTLSKNVKGTWLYLTYPGGMEFASNNGIDWEMIATNNY